MMIFTNNRQSIATLFVSATLLSCYGYYTCSALVQPTSLLRTASTFTLTAASSILGQSRTKSTAKASSPTTTTSLNGGYDSTIGPDPSNPIQFFTMSSGMCPYAARTLTVLNELNLPYEIVEVSGKPDWYLQINPRGKVPSLRVPYHNNEVVYESAICDEYLCDLYDAQMSKGKEEQQQQQQQQQQTTLMPSSDPIGKARIRLLNDRCDTELNPTFFTYLMNKDDTKEEEMKQKLEHVLQFYEITLSSDTDLGGNGGPYLNGQEFTLADIHALPFVLRMIVSLRHFKNYVISEDNYPKLVSWFDLCSERESVKVASKTDEQIISVYEKFIKMDYSFGGLNQNKST